MRRVAAFLLFFGVTHACIAAPGAFSETGLQGWEPQSFKRLAPTTYQLFQDGKTQVLQAQCSKSASGYIHKEKIDLTDTPMLKWRWRIHQTFAGLDQTHKSSDDFPARVYVVLDGGWMIWRTRALAYVWSNGESGSDHWQSPNTSQVHLVAVRKGAQGVGKWQNEQRDVRADFKTYFGIDIDHVDGVALMTDCDDSGLPAVTEYGDITFTP
jgi:hypothetical protein